MLTSHRTSLELSLALREAGYPQENALFYWWENDFGEWVLMYREELPDDPGSAVEPDRFVASPLTSELMEKMPDGYFATRIKNVWNTGLIASFDSIEGWGALDKHADTPVYALAKCWLHLRQEQLI